MWKWRHYICQKSNTRLRKSDEESKLDKSETTGSEL